MNTLTNVFDLIWPLILGGLGITLVTQFIKRIAKLEKTSVIKFLFHTVTFVWTALSYVLGAHGISALLVVLHGGALGYFGNALYPIVKYSDIKLDKIRQALKLVDQDLPAIQAALSEIETTTGVDITPSADQPDSNEQPAQNTNKTPAPADF